MHACMHACMHVCMYVCMYVCMSVYVMKQYFYINYDDDDDWEVHPLGLGSFLYSAADRGALFVVTPPHLRTSYNLFFLEDGWMVVSLSSL